MSNLKVVQEYDASKFLKVEDIKISGETEKLLEEARKVYNKNFNNKCFLDKCIFLSYYCSVNDCKFCYRVMHKGGKESAEKARRSLGSILTEAFLVKLFNWKLAFLTGGYDIFPAEDLVKISEYVSKIVDDKIWVNLGILSDVKLAKFKPYVKGVCASMETLNPELHKEVCPSKPIKPYEEMFDRLNKSKDFKKSAAIIVGLGDKREDIKYLFDFVEKHKLDSLTMYALKPIKGTEYVSGPGTDEFLWWLASMRIRFPKLEIVGGTNLRRSEEAGYMCRAGVNGITKFPATKQFGTSKAKKMVELIEKEGRRFTGNLTNADDIDFYGELDKLNLNEEVKDQMFGRLPYYVDRIKNPKGEGCGC